MYSIAPPEDLRTLEDALAGTVGPGKCDVFGYNTARIGYLYVALPSSNNAGLDMRMPAMFAQLELNNDTGRVSVGTMEEDTEENYVSPWHRLDWKEHTFIDILKVRSQMLRRWYRSSRESDSHQLNLPSRATHRTLSSGTLLRTWTTDHDGRTGQHVGSNARRVGHIVLKVRLDELRSDGMPMHPFDEFLHMWEALEYVGMRPFAASVDDDGYLEVGEVVTPTLSTTDATLTVFVREHSCSTPSEFLIRDISRCCISIFTQVPEICTIMIKESVKFRAFLARCFT